MNQRMPPVPMQRGQQFSFSYGGDAHHGGGDSLEWVIFALLLLLIALVVALLVVSLVRRSGFGGRRHRGFKMHGPPGGGRPWGRPDALDVARLRYAQGAIGRDEYLQLVQDLGGAPEPPPPPPA
jgi:uncharacterized membrane protein